MVTLVVALLKTVKVGYYVSEYDVIIIIYLLKTQLKLLMVM